MALNSRNPSIRRILADIRELARVPSPNYAAKPLEDNMHEWHFAIRGPPNTDFAGGIYHGRISLPLNYPFQPPSIIFLTPNGRWLLGTKICLSISNYHPELWQPAWGIRTILEALISFMASPSEGAFGTLETSSEVRKRLAIESLKYSHPLMPKLPSLSDFPQLHSTQTPTQAINSENVNEVKNTEPHLNFQLAEAETESERETDTGIEREKAKCEENVISRQENQKVDLKSENESENAVLEREENIESSPEKKVRTEREIERENKRRLRLAETAVRQEKDIIDTWLKNLSLAVMMAIFSALYHRLLQAYT